MARAPTASPPIDAGVCVHTLDSWIEFIEFIRVEHARFPACIYRGQADATWKVESSFDRLVRRSPKRMLYGQIRDTEATCPPASQSDHLRAFKDAARGRLLRGQPPANDNEWWALAQHHGLCTPMLDFTASPFAALFFAFEQKHCVNDAGESYEPDFRAVYGLPFHVPDMAGDKGNASTLSVSRPLGEGSYRLVSQAGLFVGMPDETDLETWVRQKFADETSITNRHPREILTKITIPNDGRIDCLKFLSKMNINRMTLFPDLDGSAAHINALWELNFDTALGHILLPEPE